jgi:hypothetical protein
MKAGFAKSYVFLLFLCAAKLNDMVATTAITVNKAA